MPTRLDSVVIDSHDVPALARWWSAALGWAVSEAGEDETSVAPPDGEPGIELVFVSDADPSPGKNRVHLDVLTADRGATVDRLRAAGATDLDVGQAGDEPWTVLADPEGNAFCVVDPLPDLRNTGVLAGITVDAVDPVPLARFWAHASGWAVARESADLASLRAPDGRGPALFFCRTGEPHTVKNRLHLDVRPFAGDDQGAEVARLEALGAAQVDIGQHDAPPGVVTWVVLADPEGNEFCVLRPPPPPNRS